MISQEISTFEKMVTQDIEKIKGNNKRNNLTANENKALRQLAEDKDIIVKPADKGGGTVILSTKYYEEEAYRILNDHTTYKKLKGDPTAETKEKFDEFLDRGYALGIINNNEYKYMKINHPRRPVFYHLPKIHKNPTRPPGRPIVSGIDSISSRLSEYIDKILQPYVNQTTSHLKDTLNILQDLDKIQWKEHYILVTSDVSALYSNIPHVEGITAVKNILGKTNSLPPEQIDYILEGIHLILTNNYFWFNEDFYLQVKGTAMGTKFAPSFANLFMAEWEEPLVQGGGENIILYRRYIDDILLIWGGGEQSLEEFIATMNRKDINIKLETQWSKEEVNFLDLTIYRKDNGIATKTFFKPVDCNNFIDKTSCHLDKWLEGVPKSQILRLRRNCTDINIFDEQTERLQEAFKEKGYDPDTLEETRKEIRKRDRTDLLKYKTRSDTQKPQLPIIYTYNQQNKAIRKIISKYWPILRQDPALVEILPEKPRFVCRGTGNLKKAITRSEYPAQSRNKKEYFQIEKGFHGCGNCLSCRSTGNKKRIIKEVDHKRGKWKIRDILTCFSKNVLYLLVCPCGLKYIGRTTRALNVRVREHIRNISKGLETHSVPLHFKKSHNCDPKNLEFLALKKIHPQRRGGDAIKLLGKEEMRFIYEFGTLHPAGLNMDFEICHFL
uniref:Reverse transcriptase domain-containing protein n=1 Tax=Leptobrachium leishanense TaxID=445787 RepID=A0A8C5MP74_9ANUR